MHNLFAHCTPVLLSSAIAASDTSTDHYTNCVDTRGYQGVAFIVNSETTDSSAFTAYAQLSATSSGTGTFIDVYGSTVSHSTGFAGAQAMEVIDVYRPSRRWARVYIDRGTTGESIHSVTALLYKPNTVATSFSTAQGVSDVNIVVGTSS